MPTFQVEYNALHRCWAEVEAKDPEDARKKVLAGKGTITKEMSAINQDSIHVHGEVSLPEPCRLEMTIPAGSLHFTATIEVSTAEGYVNEPMVLDWHFVSGPEVSVDDETLKVLNESGALTELTNWAHDMLVDTIDELADPDAVPSNEAEEKIVAMYRQIERYNQAVLAED